MPVYEPVSAHKEGGDALPRIPPGSIIAISEIDESERRSPHPEQHYFLQHRAGYTCRRCVVTKDGCSSSKGAKGRHPSGVHRPL
jgi:hypothetical protein